MYFENVFICKNAQEIICTICLVVNYEFAHILKVLRLDKTAIWLEEKRAGEIFDAFVATVFAKNIYSVTKKGL